MWFSACGLSEDVDEVKNVRICTSHFAVKDVWPPLVGSSKKNPTLKFGVVPSISIPHPIPIQTQQPSLKHPEIITRLNEVPSSVHFQGKIC